MCFTNSIYISIGLPHIKTVIAIHSVQEYLCKSLIDDTLFFCMGVSGSVIVMYTHIFHRPLSLRPQARFTNNFTRVACMSGDTRTSSKFRRAFHTGILEF